MRVPIEVRVRRGTRRLEIEFDDGAQVSLAAEYLRVESPSAEVQGHAPGQKVLVTGKQSVNIDTVEPIGNYAVRISFSDGHDTGIFPWSLLDQLAAEYPARWAAYEAAVRKQAAERH